MKSKCSVILISLFLIVCSCSLVKNNDAEEYRYIIEYGKTWGFLKYYHPNVAKGDINWDSVFIAQMQRIKTINNDTEYNSEIIEILKTAGKSDYYSDSIMTFPDSLKINYDFSWLKKSNSLNESNKNDLLYILNYHKPCENYYVQKDPVGNPTFENEKPYSEILPLDENYRLLAFFRYWNIINYYSPYKYVMDEDWAIIPSKLLGKFITADNAISYYLSLFELTAKLNDSHAFAFHPELYSKTIGYYVLPVGFGYIENKTVVSRIYHDSLAKVNNLKLGDIILKIENTPVNIIRDSLRKYIPASNEAVINRNINIYYLESDKEKAYKITILRDGKELELMVNNYGEFHRVSIKEQKQKKWDILENNIGYINFGKVEITEVDTIMNKLLNTKALIFDTRYSSQGTVEQFSNYLHRSETQFLKALYLDYNYPGIVYFSNNYTTGPDQINNDYYKGQVIILVNEWTQSHGEYTTMVLQTIPNSIVIGSQTAGADGDVSRFFLPGNINITYTGIGIFYPDGTETQRIGIKPDIVILPTIESIKNGKDLLMEKAIEVVNNLK
ncbi:S41 family peptidase [Bacteroidota bacterium]